MTGTDLCVNKPHLVPVIFEPLVLSEQFMLWYIFNGGPR